jgi:hypothetical protein
MNESRVTVGENLYLSLHAYRAKRAEAQIPSPGLEIDREVSYVRSHFADRCRMYNLTGH